MHGIYDAGRERTHSSSSSDYIGKIKFITIMVVKSVITTGTEYSYLLCIRIRVAIGLFEWYYIMRILHLQQ